MSTLGLAGLAATYDLVDALALGGGGIHLVVTDAPAAVQAVLAAHASPGATLAPLLAAERDRLAHVAYDPTRHAGRLLLVDALDPRLASEAEAVRALNTDREWLLRGDAVAVLLIVGADEPDADAAHLALATRAPDFWSLRSRVHRIFASSGADAERRVRDRLLDRLTPLCAGDRGDAARRLRGRDLGAEWVAHRLWRDGPKQRQWLEELAGEGEDEEVFEGAGGDFDGLLGDELDRKTVRMLADEPDRNPDLAPRLSFSVALARGRGIGVGTSLLGMPLRKLADPYPAPERSRVGLAAGLDRAPALPPAAWTPRAIGPPIAPDRWPAPRWPSGQLDATQRALVDAAGAALDADGAVDLYLLPEDGDDPGPTVALLTLGLLRADRYAAVLHLDAAAGLQAAITGALRAAGEPDGLHGAGEPDAPRAPLPALDRLRGALGEAPMLILLTGADVADLAFARVALAGLPLACTVRAAPGFSFAVCAPPSAAAALAWVRDQLAPWPDGAIAEPLRAETAPLDLRRALARARNAVLLTDRRCAAIPAAGWQPALAARARVFALTVDDGPPPPALASLEWHGRLGPDEASARERIEAAAHALGGAPSGRRPAHAAPWPTAEPTPAAVLAAALAERGRQLESAEADRLIDALNGQPAALRLAAGWLGPDATVPDLLDALAATRAALPDERLIADDEHRAIEAAAVLALARFEADRARAGWPPLLPALAQAPAVGFGEAVGAAVADAAPAIVRPLLSRAERRGLVERIGDEGPDRWRLCPLVRALLRARQPDLAARQRVDRWFLEGVADAPVETRGARFAAVQAEGAALLEWLADEATDPVAAVLAGGDRYARSCGPYAAWLAACERALRRALEPAIRADLHEHAGHLHHAAGDPAAALRAAAAMTAAATEAADPHRVALAAGLRADILEERGELDEALRIRREEELPVYERLGDVRGRAVAIGKVADILEARGELDEALRIRREEELPVYEHVGDVRGRAVTMSKVADILKARGELDEALHIFRDEELPVFEHLGDLRLRAVTMGRIADILQARGELDDALHIFRDEVAPVFEHLGDLRLRAVTMGRIADILQARGELDEALRIRREEQLPVYERLGDVRGRAVTMGKVADIHEACGELDEALRIRREEELPVYEHLGDVRGRAVTMGKVADILATRGELDEALRIRREEELPVFERLGDVHELLVGRANVAITLLRRGRPEDRAEAIGLFTTAGVEARRLRIPEADVIDGWLRSLGASAE